MKVISKDRGKGTVELTRRELLLISEGLKAACSSPQGTAPEAATLIREIEKLVDDPVLVQPKLSKL